MEAPKLQATAYNCRQLQAKQGIGGFPDILTPKIGTIPNLEAIRISLPDFVSYVSLPRGGTMKLTFYGVRERTDGANKP
jgi:hypothetical protein